MNPSSCSTPRHGEHHVAPEETASCNLEKHFPSFNSWTEKQQLSNAGTRPPAKMLLVHLVEVSVMAGWESTKTADIFKSFSSSNHTAAFLQNKQNKNPVNSAVYFFYLVRHSRTTTWWFVHKEKKAVLKVLAYKGFLQPLHLWHVLHILKRKGLFVECRNGPGGLSWNAATPQSCVSCHTDHSMKRHAANFSIYLCYHCKHL